MQRTLAGEDLKKGEVKNDEPNLTKKGVKGYQWNLQTSKHSEITFTIKDPKLLLSCLDVEPAVNAAKDSRDGTIRIQTFSWQTFTIQISPNITGNYQWQIPVSVTSLKFLFFVLTNSSCY